jgi:hypothetical protein
VSDNDKEQWVSFGPKQRDSLPIQSLNNNFPILCKPVSCWMLPFRTSLIDKPINTVEIEVIARHEHD